MAGFPCAAALRHTGVLAYRIGSDRNSCRHLEALEAALLSKTQSTVHYRILVSIRRFLSYWLSGLEKLL
ncbi:unnamed protein product [Angiostrongylus costaricensis]|uniref:Secreted protein n=1 Tax=Angiostrongylus costaricensis TaxID=334426 RepID=A0A0R3Q0R3_ANGCS|nr:unnamed protein product [Angiostrongylus costaricensis]